MGYIPWLKKRLKKKTKEKSIAMLSYKSGLLYAQIEKTPSHVCIPASSMPCAMNGDTPVIYYIAPQGERVTGQSNQIGIWAASPTRGIAASLYPVVQIIGCGIQAAHAVAW